MVDDGAAIVLRLEDLAVGKARAEAVGIVEAVEVHLRLGMVVGRIAELHLPGKFSTSPRTILEKGALSMVEEGLDLPATCSPSARRSKPLCSTMDLVRACT